MELGLLTLAVKGQQAEAYTGGGIGHDRFIPQFNFAAGFIFENTAEVAAGSLRANLGMTNGDEFRNAAVATLDSVHGSYFLSLFGKYIIAKDFKFVKCYFRCLTSNFI